MAGKTRGPRPKEGRPGSPRLVKFLLEEADYRRIARICPPGVAVGRFAKECTLRAMAGAESLARKIGETA